jgi:replicative DNA helicase
VSAPTSLMDLDVERRLLGLVMSTAVADGAKVANDWLERQPLEAEDFGAVAHAEVYAACRAMLREGIVVEPTTLWDRLRTRPPVVQAGGWKWLHDVNQLGDSLISSAIADYARQVREFAVRRRLLAIARQLQADAYDLTKALPATVATATKALETVTTRPHGFRTLLEMAPEVAEEVEAAQNGVARVIPTGIKKLDDVIGGLPGTLTVIGGLPAVGKSGFVASVVQNIARAGHTVGVFSLEDEAKWLYWRLLSDNSGIPNFVLRFRGGLTDYQLERVSEGFGAVAKYGGRVLVDDRQGLTAQQIVDAARHAILTAGLQVVVIDHLGEVAMEGKHKGRYDLDVADALSQLRGLANRYGVPVVVCTHLNRQSANKPQKGPPGVDSGGDAPRLEFANSAGVERMARVALALTREPNGDWMRIHVLKSTNGKAGVYVDVPFNGPMAMLKATAEAPSHLRVAE